MKLTDLMARDPKKTQCWAGRWSFYSGHPDWRRPCPDMMLISHVVFFEGDGGSVEASILLCDLHYRQLLADGMVTEPDPPPEKVAEAQRQFDA